MYLGPRWVLTARSVVFTFGPNLGALVFSFNNALNVNWITQQPIWTFLGAICFICFIYLRATDSQLGSTSIKELAALLLMAGLPKMRPTFLFFLKKENNDFVHSSIKTWKKLIIQISRPPLQVIPIVSGFLATDSPVVDVWRFRGFLSFFFWFIPSNSVVISRAFRAFIARLLLAFRRLR